MITDILLFLLVCSNCGGWYLYFKDGKKFANTENVLARDRRERDRVTGVLEQMAHRLGCLVPPPER